MSGPKKELAEQFLMLLMEENKDKDFVQRILDPDNSPKIANPDGSHSTHEMAWGEGDDENGDYKYFVFPTIMRDKKKLKRYGDKAFQEALKRKEFLTFDNAEQADWVSKNYKLLWK